MERFEEHNITFPVLFKLLCVNCQLSQRSHGELLVRRTPEERDEFETLVPSIGHRIEIKTAALRFAKPC